jgi:iron complex outermembrane receptor protein
MNKLSFESAVSGRRSAVLAAAILVAAPAHAAETPAQVVITGNPLARSDPAQAATVLSGDALAQRVAGTLGETLDGLPGVSATGFGPQASRPVIRGLDGDRIRLLDNGGASADASNLSFDHAVAVDPLVVERIEVLRGPAALLYGGNATGGVVNALDNRIPRDALTGLGGRAEWRLGGAARERSGAALLEGGAQGLNWHLDAARRDSGNLRTPLFTPVADGQALPATREVVNSAGTSSAGALGVSWADARGYAGVSMDAYRNHYGVTVEPDVTIQMRRQRVQAAGERRQLGGWFSSLSWQGSQTRYRHQELEGDGSVGTTFESTGRELRLQANQAAQPALGGQWLGTLGWQAEQLGFSALGEEAFVPTTHTRSQAVFALQTLEWAGGTSLSAGWRQEAVQVQSEGDAAGSEASRFGAPAQRRFSPHSASLSLSAPLPAWAPHWVAGVQVGSTQRAPAYYELYANGPHVATGAYEQGDAQQGAERSSHREASLQWQQGHDHFKLAVFDTRFANFIALNATGAVVATASGDLPQYRFAGVAADLRGLEAEAQHRWRAGAWTLDGSASVDGLHSRQLADGQPLPRMAPRRWTLGLQATTGPWALGFKWRTNARQTQITQGDITTPSARWLDAWLSWQQALDTGLQAQWFAKLGNVGDALVYNASAIRTARELAPAGGRALSAGVRVNF